MRLYTIGFTKKTAEKFFGLIGSEKIGTLVDIRLNNKSQLAGFTKSPDLEYFLMRLCGCLYEHCPEYAPTEEILTAYRKKAITWREYEVRYKSLMNEREAAKNFSERFGNMKRVCLLCSEETPEHCHRRLFAEMIAELCTDTEVIHIGT